MLRIISPLLCFCILLVPAGLQAKSLDMQKAMMASPMPNLMMLLMNNREVLALDSEQLQALSQWRKQNQVNQQQLTQDVLILRKQLHDLSLEEGQGELIDRLSHELLVLQSELIKVKSRCTQNVRSVLNPEQWLQLMEIYQQRRQIIEPASGSMEAKTFIRVSPFPKYMLVVIMHPDKLGLTQEQDKALDQWRITNMNDWSILFEEVHELEREITRKSLEGQTKQQLTPIYDRLLSVRREMEAKSMACADNMRNLLKPDQWQKVVEIYKSML